MDKAKIIQFIRKNQGAEVALLQVEFGIGYKEAKDVIDELVSNGELVYAEGVRYKCVTKGSHIEQFLFEEEKELDLFPDDDDDDLDEIMFDNPFKRESAANDNQLHLRALTLCIERQAASSSLLQRNLNIGFNKAAEVLEWMENRGYVSKSEGNWRARKVLITIEMLNDLIHAGEFDDKREEPQTASSSCSPHLFEYFIAKIHEADETAPEDDRPPYNTWDEDDLFEYTVVTRIEKLMRSDAQMGQKGALKKAEIYLEAVSDTADHLQKEVYERVVYELRRVSTQRYNQLKKKLFEEDTGN